MNELALFAGAGGGILGGKLLGWRTVCAVERDAYASQVLAQRQNDGILEPFPIWSDITTFDGRPWRGIVDVVSGGFPCQDISAAGKGAGIEGERSGMWKEMARIIGEVRPSYAFVENSPMLTTRGLGTVLADLVAMGFDAEWGVLSASDVGANHQRERIWIVAKQRDIFSHTEHNRNGWGKQQQEGFKKESRPMANTIRNRRNARRSDDGEHDGSIINANGEQQEMAYSSSKNAQGLRRPIGIQTKRSAIGSASWWSTEPNVGRVANGVAARVDRLKAIGNGQVPLCAATAFELLRTRLGEI